MTHPLIPQVLEIAETIAAPLGIEVVGAVMHTNKSPVVLRVDIRNQTQHTGLNDCEQMSYALEEALDQADFIPHAYVLEVSSPGIDRQLSSDREFIAFRGFTIAIDTNPPYKGKQSWQGQLVKRDQQALVINLKGRSVSIPLEQVVKVELA
ncbi:Ribosome maturation factor rimP [Thalassoporum mexicanum PCC 7367]|uniref:ribosome maturation factor RimP n=1 Tax=Thalassoporum mexicanum TaxID=3457544 RepID=UPI00029FE93C|nr:ribosome maturation factor RimP [Pseudanabaena sp. PCC 7367]AFY69027.1 Ribosome maturation factor rimP [Pseudanabaena sp. PCC 7367]